MKTATETPVRITRSRKRGARLESPNGLPVVCVTRPGKWGNPFRESDGLSKAECVELYRKWLTGEVEEGDLLTMPSGNRVAVEERPPVAELRGKNLACWCKTRAGEGPCHADVLLELSNA